jgi:hypothetical protein
MADIHGHVFASVGGLARRAQVTREDCETALAVLLSPDPDDRSGVEEGRRIRVIDRGWQIVNHGHYRDLRTPKQVADAERQRKHRERERSSRDTSQSHSESHAVATDAEADPDPDADPYSEAEADRAHARVTTAATAGENEQTLIPMPLDWTLPDTTRAALVAEKIPEWAIDEIVTRARTHYSSDPENRRRPAAWAQAVAKWIRKDWADPSKHPAKPAPQRPKTSPAVRALSGEIAQAQRDLENAKLDRERGITRPGAPTMEEIAERGRALCKRLKSEAAAA